MNFFDGFVFGASTILLITGVAQWFAKRTRPASERRLGVITEVREHVLTASGLICMIGQAIVSLIVGAIYSIEPVVKYGSVLIILWGAASLSFAVVFAFLGTRSETTYRQ